jgi:hypothetical protein
MIPRISRIQQLIIERDKLRDEVDRLRELYITEMAKADDIISRLRLRVKEKENKARR